MTELTKEPGPPEAAIPYGTHALLTRLGGGDTPPGNGIVII